MKCKKEDLMTDSLWYTKKFFALVYENVHHPALCAYG